MATTHLRGQMSSELQRYAIHEVPPGLGELIDQIWDQPFNRFPAHGRWGMVLLAVCEMIFLF
eukprot:86808-Pyramimonas_sp.AAC.1